MENRILITILFVCILMSSMGQIINVPADQPSIQAGINVAQNGDTVLVDTGIYFENISFMGKEITVTSNYINSNDTNDIINTIIDGSQATNPDSAATVMFIHNEDTTSILNGLTIRGGNGVLWQGQTLCGGGIYVYNSGAKILNNKIIDNQLFHDQKAAGAGIGCKRDENNYWVVIKNNTISNNTSTVDPTTSSSAFGGGIYSSASAIISFNIITNNACINSGNFSDAYADGGGVEIEHILGSNPATVAEISYNDISNNNVEGYKCFGGGIMVYFASVNITNNTVKKNLISAINNGDGGGIDIRYALNTIFIANNDISDNEILAGNYGRGAGVNFWNPSAELILSGNSIRNNLTDANECRGSGVLFRNPIGKISVLDNEFIDNEGNPQAENHNGGGICLNDAYDSLVIISSNIFKNNSAIQGGGLFVRRSFNLQVTNNLFVENNSIYGGGIRVYHPADDYISSLLPQITNNTLSINNSEYGGGIYFQCENNCPLVLNNIFWENQAPHYDDIYYQMESGTDTILISNCNINPDEIYGNWQGKDNINVDPLFIDSLYHLDSLSPCLNTGLDSLLVDGTWYYAPNYDLNGNPRPDTICYLFDMGAYERQDCIPTRMPLMVSPTSNNKLHIYPNPFIMTSTIKYDLLIPGYVHITVHNYLGQIVESIDQGYNEVGNHTYVWDASGLSKGIYFVRLNASDEVVTMKIIKM